MRANTITSPVLETDSLGVGGESISSFQTIKTGNPIINGNMDIAQRGTSVAIGSGITYGLDRWKVFNTTEATFDMDQVEDAPTFAQSGYKSTYCLEINPSVADTPLASNDYALMVQAIEGFNIVPFIGQTVTLSFWLYATKTGATCCKIINYGAGLEILKEFTISQSNTWEKHTWTFSLVEGQTWNTGNTGSVGINFSLGAGVDYQGAATETWSDFTYQCTANQVNHLDNASNVYRLSQVKLEIGNEATPFVGRSIQEELALCQRYFQWITYGASAYCAQTSYLAAFTPYQNGPMRTVPTISGEVDDYYFANVNCGSTSSFVPKQEGVTVLRDATVLGQVQFSGYAEAEAEL